MLLLSEEVKLNRNLNKNNETYKKSYTKVAMIYSKRKSSTPEIVKKGKEICTGFVIKPETAQVIASVHEK